MSKRVSPKLLNAVVQMMRSRGSEPGFTTGEIVRTMRDGGLLRRVNEQDAVDAVMECLKDGLVFQDLRNGFWRLQEAFRLSVGEMEREPDGR